MASKQEKEAAALAARAAARAKLQQAGQLNDPVQSQVGLLNATRNLLAARTAAGLTGGGGSSAANAGGGGSAPSAWLQAPQGYFFHRESGTTQWAQPPQAGEPFSPLPAGWHAAGSREDGGGPRYYYTPSFTNARGCVGQIRTWEVPAHPPNTGFVLPGM